MSEPNPKRPRKTKLVARSCKDGDDCDTLQDERRNRITTSKASSSSMQNEPSTSSYQPVQFDVKIEVEECDFEDTTDKSTYGVINDDLIIKTEITNENDLFEFEERDINSLLAQGLSKKRGLPKVIINEKTGTISIEDHQYCSRDKEFRGNRAQPNENSGKKSNKDHQDYPREKEIRKRNRYTLESSHLQLEEDEILKSLDDLPKEDMSLADNVLSVEMRNIWGRCRMIPHNSVWPENKLQIAINTWKYWKVSCRGGEVPLMYKCYVCKMAWWHLGPFQDHLATHKQELVIVSESQLETNLCNIVAHSPAKTNNVFNDFKIHSDCWRCGYDFEHHIKSDTLNLCKYCHQRFQTCFKHRAHEAECVPKLRILVKTSPLVVFTCHICNIKFMEIGTLEQHYTNYHDVRSDLPMCVDVKTCMACSENYVSLPFHFCSKKNYSIMCTYCEKRFPSKIALDIHSNEISLYPCIVCNEKLPKKCMLDKHMLKHTDKFMMLYKCLLCKENVLLLSEELMRQHKIIWHRQKLDKRRNCFEMVLVPRQYIEARKLDELDDVMKSSGENGHNVGKEENTNVSDCEKPSTSVDISEFEVKSTENEENEPMIIISNCEKPSTSVDMSAIEVNSTENEENETILIEYDGEPSNGVKIKEEIDEEFEDLDDSIVQEKMLEEMQKNNNFAEDDEGYEHILSSVFNTSNFKSEIVISDETDDFEELINQELVKNIGKNAKKGPTRKEITAANNEKKKKLELQKVVKKPRYKCDFQGCDFAFDDIGEFRSHRPIHKATIVGCSKCSKSFITFKSYLVHLTDHGYKKLACPQCLKIYSCYPSLAAHIRVKLDKLFSKSNVVDKDCATYKCKKCKVYVPKKSFLDHWESHLSLTPTKVKVEDDAEDEEENDVYSALEIEYDRPQVDRVADDITPEVLTKILASLVSTNKRLYDKWCRACGRKFERKNDCKRHHVEHLLTNAYGTKYLYKGLRCQICYKIYDRPDAYKKHMRDHGQLPVYECNLCFKTFSDSSNHVKHQKTHSSHYICDICNKKFQQKLSLIKHMESHLNISSFNCIFCPKKFYTESDIARHVRNSHGQNVLKYSCMICKMKFKRTKEKWEHMWIQHKERRVKADCPICSAEYRKINDVKRHMKAEHGMEISVLNMKLFGKLIKNMKDGKDVDDQSLLVVKNTGEDTKIPYYVNEEGAKKCKVFDKNDMLTLINNELSKTTDE